MAAWRIRLDEHGERIRHEVHRSGLAVTGGSHRCGSARSGRPRPSGPSARGARIRPVVLPGLSSPIASNARRPSPRPESGSRTPSTELSPACQERGKGESPLRWRGLSQFKPNNTSIIRSGSLRASQRRRMRTSMRAVGSGGPSWSRHLRPWGRAADSHGRRSALGHLQSPTRITQVGPPPFSGGASLAQFGRCGNEFPPAAGGPTSARIRVR
jgi:hypothetical protein